MPKMIPKQTHPYERDRVWREIVNELDSALEEFNDWPEDIVYANIIVQEEAGELTKAINQFVHFCGTIDEIRTEAIHTAAMAVQFLLNLRREDKDVPKSL